MSELILKESKLPKNWITENLGDISELFVPMRDKPKKFDGNTPWLRIEDLDGKYAIDSKSNQRVSEKTILDMKLRVYPIGTVLCSCSATIGLCAITKNELITNQTFIGIYPTDALYNEFLYYFMLSQTNYLKNIGTGITIKYISRKKFENISIHLPPLNEQKRIVKKIEELFSKIEETINLLKEIQNQIKNQNVIFFKDIFQGNFSKKFRLENNKVEEINYLANLEQNIKKYTKKSEKLIEIDITSKIPLPKTWYWTHIGKISHVVRGASPRPAGSPKYFGGKIPWITVKNLTKDENMYLNSVEEFLNKEGKEQSRYLKPETLMLTNSGATLGVPKISKIEGCINDGIVALLYVDYPLKKYLYYYLRTLTKKLRMLNQGAAQPNLNTTIVKSILVPLPPVGEQKDILEKIDNFTKKQKNISQLIESTLNQLPNLKHVILKQAFKGKLVPQDPNDEPAEILLQKIKQEKEQLKQKEKSKKRKKNGR